MKKVEVTFAASVIGSENGFDILFFEAGQTALITEKLADLFGRLSGALVPEDENEGGEPPDSGDSEGGGGLKDKLSYNSGSTSTETSTTVEVNKTL